MNSTPRNDKLDQLSAHMKKAASHGLPPTFLRLGDVELPNATINPYETPNVWIVRARLPVSELPQNWPPSLDCRIESYGSSYAATAEDLQHSDSLNGFRDINFLVKLDRPFPDVWELQDY